MLGPEEERCKAPVRRDMKSRRGALVALFALVSVTGPSSAVILTICAPDLGKRMGWAEEEEGRFGQRGR